MTVEQITREYSRYFISNKDEQNSRAAPARTRKGWVGKLSTNTAVDQTLLLFQALEKQATPQEKLNWRFQEGLYRAVL